MTRRIVIVLVVALLVFPAASAAKGPAAATLTGPRLDEPIRFQWSGRVADLGLLVEQSGFFAAAFGQAPNPMLARRPEGSLGPRYTITYDLGNPVRQHVYPWARGGPLTHVPGGQRFWNTETVDRGWYRAPRLRDTLVAAGLPPEPPQSSKGRGLVSIAALALASVVVFMLVVLLIERARGARADRPAPPGRARGRRLPAGDA